MEQCVGAMMQVAEGCTACAQLADDGPRWPACVLAAFANVKIMLSCPESEKLKRSGPPPGNEEDGKGAGRKIIDE